METRFEVWQMRDGKRDVFISEHRTQDQAERTAESLRKDSEFRTGPFEVCKVTIKREPLN